MALERWGEPDGERMWVKVTERREGHYVGTLANDPVALTELCFGDIIDFAPERVIAIHLLEGPTLTGTHHSPAARPPASVAEIRHAYRRLILCQLSVTLAGVAIGTWLLLAGNTTAGIAMVAASIISTPALALVARRPLTRAEQEAAAAEPDH